MTELTLEVGKTYVDRRGNKVLITLNTSHATESHFPFYSNGNTFTSKGTFYAHDEHSRDLISEYVQPASPVQPAARTPRPHAQLRKDFADGWDIEFLSKFSGKWEDVQSEPDWCISYQYRIKPAPDPLKPNKVRFIALGEQSMGASTISSDDLVAYGCKRALRIEFNPNDQTLVSAEVVTL